MANYSDIEKITAENLEAVAGGIKWGALALDQRIVVADKIGLADAHIAKLANSDNLAAEDKLALAELASVRSEGIVI